MLGEGVLARRTLARYIFVTGKADSQRPQNTLAPNQRDGCTRNDPGGFVGLAGVFLQAWIVGRNHQRALCGDHVLRQWIVRQRNLLTDPRAVRFRHRIQSHASHIVVFYQEHADLAGLHRFNHGREQSFDGVFKSRRHRQCRNGLLDDRHIGDGAAQLLGLRRRLGQQVLTLHLGQLARRDISRDTERADDAPLRIAQWHLRR